MSYNCKPHKVWKCKCIECNRKDLGETSLKSNSKGLCTDCNAKRSKEVEKLYYGLVNEEVMQLFKERTAMAFGVESKELIKAVESFNKRCNFD